MHSVGLLSRVHPFDLCEGCSFKDENMRVLYFLIVFCLNVLQLCSSQSTLAPSLGQAELFSPRITVTSPEEGAVFFSNTDLIQLQWTYVEKDTNGSMVYNINLRRENKVAARRIFSFGGQ